MLSTPRNDPSTLGAVTQPTPPSGYPQAGYPSPGYYPGPAPKRRMSTLALLGIIFGAMFVACLGIGGAVAIFGSDPNKPAVKTTTGATTKPAKGPTVVQLGQALTFSRFGTEVTYILNPGSSPKKDKYGDGPQKGAFFTLNASIEVKKGSTYACPCDVALVAKDGTVYEPTIGIGFDGALEAVNLNAGQKAAGLIVWDLPAAAIAGARIELRADVFADSGRGYWQLP